MTNFFGSISDFNPSGEGKSSIEHILLNNICVNLSHILSVAPTLHTLDTTIDAYEFHCTEKTVYLDI